MFCVFVDFVHMKVKIFKTNLPFTMVNVTVNGNINEMGKHGFD